MLLPICRRHLQMDQGYQMDQGQFPLVGFRVVELKIMVFDQAYNMVLLTDWSDVCHGENDSNGNEF